MKTQNHHFMVNWSIFDDFFIKEIQFPGFFLFSLTVLVKKMTNVLLPPDGLLL